MIEIIKILEIEIKMNKEHKNIIYTTKETNTPNNKNDCTLEEFIDLTYYNPLHTLSIISDILKLTDK